MKCSKKVDCDLSEPSENEATFLDQWLLSIGQTKPITFRKRQIRNNDLHFTYIRLLEFLLESARKVGVEGAAEFLEDPNKGLKEVNEELHQFSANISGVPHYVINGKYQLSGGQPPESFLRAFQMAAADAS
ncbi:unnamed protein product [Coffea canephora]|uniref:DSBA-like thioredoxin domain-containing protein n=1 Tax=Coffea canephora TaxID=49390 RepID=A0A068U3Z8_COFCA|nr:unnamed protein product [Coffea canephora]